MEKFPSFVPTYGVGREIVQRCILHGSSEGPPRYSARGPVVTDPGSASTLH